MNIVYCTHVFRSLVLWRQEWTTSIWVVINGMYAWKQFAIKNKTQPPHPPPPQKNNNNRIPMLTRDRRILKDTFLYIFKVLHKLVKLICWLTYPEYRIKKLFARTVLLEIHYTDNSVYSYVNMLYSVFVNTIFSLYKDYDVCKVFVFIIVTEPLSK